MISKLLKDVPYIKLSICKQNYALPVLCMLYEDMFIHVAIFGTYQDVFISMIFSKSHNGYITTGIPWWANSYDIWYILCYLYFDFGMLHDVFIAVTFETYHYVFIAMIYTVKILYLWHTLQYWVCIMMGLYLWYIHFDICHVPMMDL